MRPRTKSFLHYLNSSSFIDFLQYLTGIPSLIPDPHYIGGGYQEVKRGGMLKMHIDFAKHPATRLDRRLNCLIYLNKNWIDAYNGHLMLYNAEFTNCEKSISPIFNRMVVFSTTNTSFHGLPEPLMCPPNVSRKSLALYYYTNGRPESELRPSTWKSSTFFRERDNEKFDLTNTQIDDMSPVMWDNKLI